MLVVPIDLARRSARQFLLQAPTKAIRHLQTKLARGEVIGVLYSRCPIGVLAAGSGYSLSNKVKPARTLTKYMRNLGIERTTGEYEPIEVFTLGIGLGDTPENNDRAMYLNAWCEEVLCERGENIARVVGQISAPAMECEDEEALVASA